MFRYMVLMVGSIIFFYLFSIWIIQEIWMTNFRPQPDNFAFILSSLAAASLISFTGMIWAFYKILRLVRSKALAARNLGSE